MNEETCGPLIAARIRIDETIQAYLDKIAMLRKRREALTVAIDLIRAGDDEIIQLPRIVGHQNGKARVFNFDEKVVEEKVIEILKVNNSCSFKELQNALDNNSLTYSLAGLKRILATCPGVQRVGERDKTVYCYTGGPNVG